MRLLDTRLSAVLSQIPRGSCLLDIGTDHCKLPAEGLLSGRLSAAFAADLREGPLEAARRQLSAEGLLEQVPLFLSDGLREIPREVLQTVDCVCIAGMGGEVIASIIENAPLEPPLWVLQPMSAVYELMDYLGQKGYRLLSGALAADKEKIYRIFTVRKTNAPYTPDYFSIYRGDPLYETLLDKEERRVTLALQGLRSAKNPSKDRILEEERLLKLIGKARL